MAVKFKLFLLPPVFIGLILLVSVPSECNTRPVIFNFGDSNSDTGTYEILHGSISQLPQVLIHSLNISFQGRLCDGGVVLDFLCESLNASYLSPFMESTHPNFENGVNFAMSGSATLPRYAYFSLHLQVEQFSRFKWLSLDLLSKGDLLGNEELADALFVIDIGQNDLEQAFDWRPYDDALQTIPSFVTEIELAVMRLYVHGGRKFWIHNTGPLGCLPKLLSKRKYEASDLDQYGCAKAINEGARLFNEQLRRMCDKLPRELMGITVVCVDIYAIKYDLIANASTYGFKVPMKACCGYGGGRYNYHMRIQCGVPGFQVCENRSEYLNWDGGHFTEAANRVIASKILSTHYTTPPLTLAHIFSPVAAATAPAPAPSK